MRTSLLLICLSTLALAEDMPPPPASMKIPPAPILSPKDALASFKVQSGLRIELAASEPLIDKPVQMVFDPDGRLWVVEMPSYMMNPTGQGEDQTTGKVVVLEDSKGDGVFDKATVFLDGLVLPRSLAVVEGGVLVAEPPKVWFCRIGADLKCAEKTEVAGDYGNRSGPEHLANALMPALDNWIYNANYTGRFRRVNGAWQRDKTITRGQWGLTQDDFGRLFYNSNSDMLRIDLVPSAYLQRNPEFTTLVGTNFQTAASQEVWPSRVNPGVNRGYQKGQLRADGTLHTYTAVCGPSIYRGDALPKEFEGNAFVCEPSGNIVRRNILTESLGKVSAANAYDKVEFLSSTDERFRPVNSCTGPDGALYIIDMQCGILQHRVYLTPYLSKQAVERGLDKCAGLGRIYRIVPPGFKPGPKPKLSKASTDELVAALSHANGWWRDTAQRLLVEHKDPAAATKLRELATTGANPLGRLHALWTLEGLGACDAATVTAALADKHPKVRAAAIRLAEPLLAPPARAQLIDKLAALASDSDAAVQLQLALSLGPIGDPKTDTALVAVLHAGGDNAVVRDAVISGLGGRELEFIEHLIADAATKPGAVAALPALIGCVIAEGRPERIGRLLGDAVTKPALLDAIAGAKPKKLAAPIRLTAAPVNWATLEKSSDAKLRDQAKSITAWINWTGDGKPVVVAEKGPTAPPLTTDQQASFERGKLKFLTICGVCHQPTGLGLDGLAPPLRDSSWAIGPEQRLIRIAIQGVKGTITAAEKTVTMDMPPPAPGILDDGDIADVLTYIRREWGHTASPVDVKTVEKTRAAIADRGESWTAEELLKIP